jgi:hypothetical protein
VKNAADLDTRKFRHLQFLQGKLPAYFATSAIFAATMGGVMWRFPGEKIKLATHLHAFTYFDSPPMTP